MFFDVIFGLFGLAVLLGIAAAFSNNKRSIDWQLVATGVILQIMFAALVLLVPGGKDVFDALGKGFVAVLGFVGVGSNFIFGSLMDTSKFGFIFAFQVLPTIIFFAALMGVLYYLGVMQWIVRIMALAITKVMRVSGAETTSVCASVFIGQTEAPLTVRPYIARMTESELITMMIGGMAHIAGGVLAAYVGMLSGGDPVEAAFYAKHLLAASIMAAPATLVIAKILIPETGIPLTRGTVKMEVEQHASNVIDAAASGAADGLKLALNIAAMLLAFIALIALLNWPLNALGNFSSTQLTPTGLTASLVILGIVAAISMGLLVLYMAPTLRADLAARLRQRIGIGWVAALALISLIMLVIVLVPGSSINESMSALVGRRFELGLESILGYLMAPIAWVIGVPWQDATIVGSLIGQKIVINEFVAYLQLADIIKNGADGVMLTDQGKLIATYALCGFANFSSIAIQIGGIGGLAPERRADLARFGMRAVLGGSLATFMTATIAGVLMKFSS